MRAAIEEAAHSIAVGVRIGPGSKPDRYKQRCRVVAPRPRRASRFERSRRRWLGDNDYETGAQAIAAIDDYIEGFHNTHRSHSSIGYVARSDLN